MNPLTPSIHTHTIIYTTSKNNIVVAFIFLEIRTTVNPPCRCWERMTSRRGHLGESRSVGPLSPSLRTTY